MVIMWNAFSWAFGVTLAGIFLSVNMLGKYKGLYCCVIENKYRIFAVAPIIIVTFRSGIHHTCSPHPSPHQNPAASHDHLPPRPPHTWCTSCRVPCVTIDCSAILTMSFFYFKVRHQATPLAHVCARARAPPLRLRLTGMACFTSRATTPF
jgi:hypothetical protein